MAEPRRSTVADRGDLNGARMLVVEARFYDDIADALLAGATPAIAMALEAAARLGNPYEGVVALGCVIRGDTIHFEIVSTESARALMELSVARGVPIGNGILTVDTEAQAWARARVEEADKGGDAARAALALVRLKHRLGAR